MALVIFTGQDQNVVQKRCTKRCRCITTFAAGFTFRREGAVSPFPLIRHRPTSVSRIPPPSLLRTRIGAAVIAGMGPLPHGNYHLIILRDSCRCRMMTYKRVGGGY